MRTKQNINKRVALLVMLGGPLAWYIGFQVNAHVPLINYRDLPIADWAWDWLTAAIVLYAAGVYVTARMQFEFRHATNISPGQFTYQNRSETVECPRL